MGTAALQQAAIEEKEGKDRIVSIVLTVLVHALLVLILFMFGVYKPNPPLEEMAGIPVDFGTSDVGSGDVQAESVKIPDQIANSPNPTTQAATPPATPQNNKADDHVVTQEQEEAIALNEAKKKPEPKPVKEEVKPTPVNTKPQPITDVKPVKKDPPAPTGPTLAKGSTMGKPTGRDKPGSNGNDNTPGDKGSLFGDKGNAYTGVNGYGDTPGPGVGGKGGDYFMKDRKLLFKPKLVGDIQEAGTVVVTITVDRNGKVINTDCCSAKGTTTKSQALISKALEDSRKIKFDANPNAPEQQTGTVTFTFKLQ